ncbi:MAG: peptidylprolyl isomerase [Acidimicrobiia bacterium]
MRRPWLVLFVVLAALGVAAGCGSSPSGAAATVDGVDISRASLEEELRAIDSDDAYRSALEQSYGVTLAGEGKGTFNTAFAAQVLTLRVYYELIEQALEDGDEEVTTADLDEAEAAVKEQFGGVQGGADIFDSFPKAYRDRLVRQQALVTASTRMVVGDGADAEAFFNANPTRFAQTCVSHVLVGLTDRDDAAAKARADDLKRRLDRGESFAALANAESDDEGPDGDLGCHIPGQFVAEFEAAMGTATVGRVTDPVKSQFGYHLILVRERRSPTFVDVREEVEAVISRANGEALDEFLVELTCGDDREISIDDRYGSWDRSECGGDTSGLGKVTAPGGPTTTTAG